MTSCHNTEANEIDRIIEEAFVKNNGCFTDFFGSITPLL